MRVVFDLFMEGEKKSIVVVDAPNGMFRTEADLVKEVKYLASEFKTHCNINKSAYHPSHFVNYVRKYTRITINYGFPCDNVRLDF